MPQAKIRPSDIAAEAKKTYIPYIERKLPQYPVHSYLHADSSSLSIKRPGSADGKLRVAVIDGDPVDVAIDWHEYEVNNSRERSEAPAIPVVNMANEKRAGGDWESGLMAPEECFSRRSNLVHALNTFWPTTGSPSHYPIPQKGGIYSPNVVVFRSGPDQYQVWRDFKVLPVISVAPVRRPKLDESGTRYSFEQERELMMEKMRTVLRIAAAWGHSDLCLGAFGVGHGFRNPVTEIASMWRTILFSEPEFQGLFSNIVFAIESSQTGNAKGGLTDYEVFKQEFDPSNIFRTAYR
ncbi:hypothetical protein L228DRAFT_159494 [Xylona heveae TC161]|uniref:Microbial-type PARG catalytic domain-containing protein n=1 Tax=Xylona heveae (strain CBS 132557 / TC161) TaxID=1328760 RepID=A0A165G5P4_XYLHT|nr:hypothetical protein L228DRAFT_159494 [Xylona heveae TC161]KZF21766.1 hypothetical protein L228DRAFT_159494 [Xylona heveae TC161]